MLLTSDVCVQFTLNFTIAHYSKQYDNKRCQKQEPFISLCATLLHSSCQMIICIFIKNQYKLLEYLLYMFLH
jgi:hypothetical protein